MRSTGVSLNESQGTQQPIYARIAAMQFWRRSVDLPPMFGPVTKSNPWPLEGSIKVSLGMKFEP